MCKIWSQQHSLPRSSLTCAGVAVILGALTAGCGSSGTSASSASGAETQLQLAVVEPFSGPNASYGPVSMAGCIPAVAVINQDGGVVGGHKLSCIAVDTIGDPVDGLAAVRKMLATTSGLVGILGPDGGTADAVIPPINAAKISIVATNGGSNYDHSSYQYYWRVVPSDTLQGTGMAVAGHDAGFTRAAIVFANDPSSQSGVPQLTSAFERLGGTISINESIAPQQPNYRSEVARLLATHPSVIFLFTDPATAATYWSNLKELQSKPIPVIGQGAETQPPWVNAVSAATGKSYLSQYFSATTFYSVPGGSAVLDFQRALTSKAAAVPDKSQYLNSPYSYSIWDSANIVALAMEAAHSTSPSVFNAYVPRITGLGGGNKVVVHDFAAGKSALDKGEQIAYVGASGPLVFNQYHNTVSAFVVIHFTATLSLVNGTVISVAAIDSAAQ